MRRALSWLALSLLATFVMVVPATAASKTVQAKSNDFTPQTVTITAGDEVVWEQDSTVFHTVTADDGSFRGELDDPGSTFRRTFPNAGQFSYFCEPHKSVGMTGVVVVQEAPPASTTPTTGPPATTASTSAPPATTQTTAAAGTVAPTTTVAGAPATTTTAATDDTTSTTSDADGDLADEDDEDADESDADDEAADEDDDVTSAPISDDDGGGGGALPFIVIAAVVVLGGAATILLRRRGGA